MKAAIKAGIAYFVLIFAAGFVFGSVRAFVLIPLLGETGRALGMLIELPIVLGLSWFVCGYLISNFGVGAARSERLAMGVTAFVLLLTGELALRLVSGRSFSEFIASYTTWEMSVGLAAQILFGAVPLIRE
ncbi:MAG: hypothetical protein ACT4OG_05355 [Alphaproteobacteria bacterium]